MNHNDEATKLPSGFDCPEGTRLIIQRPDGYLTMLVTGQFRVINHIAVSDGGKDEMVGATLHLAMQAEPDEDGTLYTIAKGTYGEGS